ncbi:MAG TPA: hypothetical protein VJN64_13020 [Terriglobales bacterium]|nr:hypothetical protein [Terriglobales bacterium]
MKPFTAVLISIFVLAGSPVAFSQPAAQPAQQNGAAQAQPSPPRSLEDELRLDVQQLATELRNASSPNDREIKATLHLSHPQLVALALANKYRTQPYKYADFVKTIEESRTDKQVGTSSSNGAGGTSVVSKGSVPAVLGFAVENGALTQSVSGTTITFRGNPVGIVQLLQREDFVNARPFADTSTAVLSRFSFGVSFDASRGNGSNGIGPNSSPQQLLLTGDRQQLSSFSLHLDLINKRDPRDRYYRDQWNALTAADVTDVGTALAAVIIPTFGRWPEYTNWENAFKAAVQAANPDELDNVVAQQLTALSQISVPGNIVFAIKSFTSHYEQLLNDRADLLNIVAHGPLLSVEYIDDFSIPTTKLPDQSTFKIIGETGLFRGSGDLTGNFNMQFWNAVNATTANRRFEYFDLSAQMDVPLTNPARVGGFVLTGAYKYRNYQHDSLATDGSILIPKGTMQLGQIKLTIPAKGSGVKVPISVSFANRSEFIKESDVRGNIGVTFDLDTLLAGLK